MDLKNVGQEIAKRDKKIQDLMADRNKLKGILKKAKTAVDSMKAKLDQTFQQLNLAEREIASLRSKNKDLESSMEIIQKQRLGIDKDEVSKILCRVRCNDIGYSLLQKKDFDCVWFADSLVINIQEQLSHEWKEVRQVNYNTVFDQQLQVENNLSSCMAQYEERLKRVNEYMEQSNA